MMSQMKSMQNITKPLKNCEESNSSKKTETYSFVLLTIQKNFVQVFSTNRVDALKFGFFFLNFSSRAK